MLRNFIAAFVLIFIAGCAGLPEPITSGTSSTHIPMPFATTQAPVTITVTREATRTSTPIPATVTPSAPAPSFTWTPTPENTLAPTPAGTLDTLRRTPPTLMLHMSNPDFDSVKFLAGMVQILQEHKLRVVTYQAISAHPEITATEQGRLFIITIDDVSLQAEIDPSIQKMIAILREAGYPAVLGVVTAGKGTNANTVRTLKELAGEGWEIAMHTDSHADLHEIEKVSMYGARQEIQTCRKKIMDAIGVKPITLVLPYGDMVENLKIMYRENIVWAVGIVAGEKYRTTNYVYYVGRESPATDPETTFRNLMNRFNP